MENTLYISKNALHAWGKKVNEGDIDYFNYDNLEAYLSDTHPTWGGEPCVVNRVIDDGDLVIVELEWQG